MSLQNRIKIKNLMEDWPKGQVATSAWLKSTGISSQLTQRYLQSGWIETIGVGAYQKPKEPVNWVGGLATLQSQLFLNVHLGGPTAFSVRGGRTTFVSAKSGYFSFLPLMSDFQNGLQILTGVILYAI